VVNKPAATAQAEPDKDWERMGEERKVLDEIDQQLRDAAIQQRYNTTEIQAHIFEKYGENDTKHLTDEQKRALVKDLKLGKVPRQKAK
jgi:predicted DNA binding protein